ncbi:NAD(P)-binding protein [Rhodobacteraceae bacterium SC52]|nr:NAD(P)-binding protein [Rhodobacteraceae bacterium SC52]
MVIETQTLILGAGLTGLTVAAGLNRLGEAPVVLDKSRGLGGRLATRRVGEWRFDHGAQYLRPRGPQLAALLDALKVSSAVTDWAAVDDGAPAYVGLPGMSGLVKPLAEGVDVRKGVRISSARREQERWHLYDADGGLVAKARVLISTIPAPQAAQVLAGHPLSDRIASVVMDPCWTLMAAFDERPDLPDISRAPDTVLPWIARDGSKPGRGTETWVAQASAEWTRDAIDLSRQDAAQALLAVMRDRAGGALPNVLHADAHRWLYSQAPKPLGQPCLVDRDAGLVVAGDWCLGARAEHAVLSGDAALAVLQDFAVAEAAAG